MKKVLHSVSIMNRGGEETFIMNVFRKIDRDKIQFDFLCVINDKGDYDDEIHLLGGHIHYLKINRIKGPIKQLDNAYLLYKFLRIHRGGYDVFHLHTQHAMDGFLSGCAAKLAGIKTVIVHSHNTSTDFHKIAHFVFRPLLNCLPIKKFACSNAAGKWLFGKKTFTVIHNAIDVDIFNFNNEIRNRTRAQNYWDDKFVVGHIGRFNYQKNHDFLIEVFEKLSYIKPNAVLVLVGSGSDQDRIKQQVEKLKLKDKVFFMGTRADVAELYQGMDCFLFPSRYEGLPVTLVEAQATGLPCFVSDKITREICATKLIDFMSLNQTPVQWANKIIGVDSCEKERRSYAKEITEFGYNINNVVKEMEYYYSL